MKNKILLVVFTFLFVVLACKKKTIQTELEKLPPATEEGKNTFGCLINGKAWIPKGWDGNKPNFYIIADPTFANGNLSIRTYKIDNDIRENLIFNSDTIKATGNYEISDFYSSRVIFVKAKSDLTQYICEIPYTGTYKRSGVLRITKYDLQSGIISGTFELIMANPLCGYGDTIKITNGRFDYKL